MPIFLKQPTLEAQNNSSPKSRQPWTMVHGFYAIMGGFAIYVPKDLPSSEKFLPDDASETWFLRFPLGFLSLNYLLEQEAYQRDFPDVSEAEIKSKSKADGFAKTLVCIQAFWFISQCLTRRMSSKQAQVFP